MKERLSLTPGPPIFIARRLENLEDKVSPEEQETYRSGVGTLLYLTKHSRPDICNPVRELSKTMDAPSPVHPKEMYKLIRFLLSTNDFRLKFQMMKNIMMWALKALSDITLPVTRKQMDTYCIIVEYELLGEAKEKIVWCCQQQKQSTWHCQKV